jgi:hypothetical protein
MAEPNLSAKSRPGPMRTQTEQPQKRKWPWAIGNEAARMGSRAAKAWLVSLACDRAKEHGYAHELWTTWLLARHARERGPAAGHECLARLVQGTGARSSAKRKSSRTRCATI